MAILEVLTVDTMNIAHSLYTELHNLVDAYQQFAMI
jgi:hypothetical protein